MERYFDTALNNKGEPAVGLTVTVTDSNGATATLYSDNGVTQTDNPFFTDKNGAFSFYAANGRYTATLTADGVAPASIKDVILNDPADKYFGDTQLAAGLAADLANTANGKGADLVANATKKVASIAALRALRVPQGSDAQTVIVDGYACPHIWISTSSATDDGALYVNPTGNAGVGRWVLQVNDAMNPKWYGAKGDGSADDTSSLINAICALPQRGKLTFAPASAYKITGTLNVNGKAGAVIDFGNQQINASGFAASQPSVSFLGNAEARISNLYVIGSKTYTSIGAYFAADSSDITIHAIIDKVRISSCDIGVQFGSPTYQFSDSDVYDVYASDCNTGVKLTGDNTLAMRYGRVAAYNNTNIGVHLEEGGGSIESLQPGHNGTDLFIGHTDGTLHANLARWDILSGYSEEGASGERFIDSAACTDTNPFTEQVVINGMRITPFSSTNVADFIRWKLNGDLILKNCNINHGQQDPYISVDHNTSYRAPRVILEDCVIDCSPKTATQVMMNYKLTDPRQQVEINARVNNGASAWQNANATGFGAIKHGVYMKKLKLFEQSLRGVAGLVGAWNLRDLPSGTCKNLVLNQPDLTLSATMQQLDFWLDDGLVGFYQDSTTAKTLSTTSANYAAAAQYTFGAILRQAGTGSGEENNTALGGASGIRISINDTGGGSLLCQAGTVNAFVAVTHPYDPHLVIGRYNSATQINVDAINLRTGEIFSGKTTANVPAYTALTWSNGLSLTNTNTVRGFPFVYNRALADTEVSQLLQSALQLTDSWRLS